MGTPCIAAPAKGQLTLNESDMKEYKKSLEPAQDYFEVCGTFVSQAVESLSNP